MTGTWAVNINVGTGGWQQQADAAVSFPIPLNEKPAPAKVIFLNEKQVSEPGSVVGCAGSANAPVAEPGFTCVYTGGTAVVGCQEAENHNAKFFSMEDAAGNKLGGKLGNLVVFRTTEFAESPEPLVKLAAPANLCAAGSWAVTELK